MRTSHLRWRIFCTEPTQKYQEDRSICYMICTMYRYIYFVKDHVQCNYAQGLFSFFIPRIYEIKFWMIRS